MKNTLFFLLGVFLGRISIQWGGDIRIGLTVVQVFLFGFGSCFLLLVFLLLGKWWETRGKVYPYPVYQTREPRNPYRGRPFMISPSIQYPEPVWHDLNPRNYEEWDNPYEDRV